MITLKAPRMSGVALTCTGLHQAVGEDHFFIQPNWAKMAILAQKWWKMAFFDFLRFWRRDLAQWASSHPHGIVGDLKCYDNLKSSENVRGGAHVHRCAPGGRRGPFFRIAEQQLQKCYFASKMIKNGIFWFFEILKARFSSMGVLTSTRYCGESKVL